MWGHMWNLVFTLSVLEPGVVVLVVLVVVMMVVVTEPCDMFYHLTA